MGKDDGTEPEDNTITHRRQHSNHHRLQSPVRIATLVDLVEVPSELASIRSKATAWRFPGHTDCRIHVFRAYLFPDGEICPFHSSSHRKLRERHFNIEALHVILGSSDCHTQYDRTAANREIHIALSISQLILLRAPRRQARRLEM